MRTTEIGEKYNFEPSCALYADTKSLSPQHYGSERIRVTGEIDFIHLRHGWFRVRYRLPGFESDQHECFRLPRTEPAARIRYGNPQRIGPGHRRGDARYDYRD